MATLYVNDKPIDIGTEKLNLVQAAGRAGVFIPHYCWHPALSVVASCRMCLVEVGEKKPDGTEVMQPRVVPACQTPAKDGTIVRTLTEKARAAQEQTLEGLLLNHPLDCPVCDKAGECLLQDYSYRFGKATSRMIDEKNQPPNKDYIGERITLFTDRCIMCSRCVRFTREISGTAELQVINRGDHSEIDIFPGEPLNNKLAGNVVDLCPVGALCDKEFLYKQRVWFLKSQKSVCAGCATGCSIWVDHNKDIVYRLRPRENPKAQGYFICDEGRHDYAYVNSPDRLQAPLVRHDDGAQKPIAWSAALSYLRDDLMKAATREPDKVGFVLSPFLTCEEAYQIAKFAMGLSSQVRLYLGWVPVVGEDDSYPKDRRGNPIEPVKFTIRAEKCPNRRGVEEVLQHFQGEALGLDRVVTDADSLQALWITGGYPPRLGTWPSGEQTQALHKVSLLVVQDLTSSPLTIAAKYVLPAASFAEKDGCYINHAGLCQELHWAVRPNAAGKTEGQVFHDLLERRGLFHAPTVRQEMAREVPFFRNLMITMDDHGINLH